MFEAIEIIQKLFTGSLAGKDVKHAGEYYKLESTRLWTMPDEPTADPGGHRRTGDGQARRAAPSTD